jgi:hypothetical protein
VLTLVSPDTNVKQFGPTGSGSEKYTIIAVPLLLPLNIDTPMYWDPNPVLTRASIIVSWFTAALNTIPTCSSYSPNVS